MNNEQRTALADELAEAIDDELQEILVTLLRTGPEFVDDAAANIRSVVSHAAIAAAREKGGQGE